MKVIVAGVFLIIALTPSVGVSGACEFKPGETVRVTGTYVPGKPDYVRAFVFAVQLDCGTKELVTVQRPTGDLPVCQPKDRVEVVGKLGWSKFLIDGHYEIINPSSVTCLPAAQGTAPAGTQPTAAAAPETTAQPTAAPQRVEGQAPAQPAPVAAVPSAPSSAAARTLGPGVWVGRYQDSRGGGDVTFSLVRGSTTVSGTWKMRTGGGGPLTGLLEQSGRRMQLRMENIASECPGTFEGSAEISDTAMVATYRGTDCEGPVTGGTLQLRPK